MKQLTTPEQIVNLSPLAKKKLVSWLRKRDYGMTLPDGECVSPMQLDIGTLIHFLEDHEMTGSVRQVITNWDIAKQNGEKPTELIDDLFDVVQYFLEQKN